MDLLLDGGVREAEHGVVSVQDLQLLATPLEFLNVDQDCVSGRRRDVGNVQNLQTWTVSLKLEKILF